MVCSPYKFCGPHLGVLAADPALLADLRPDKLLPSSDVVPERFELGTLPYELLAGTTAAVDYLAGLGEGEDRPARLDQAFDSAGSPTSTRCRTDSKRGCGSVAPRLQPGLPVGPRPSCSTCPGRSAADVAREPRRSTG